jgi:maltodextrin utilization protein YvdJ
MSIVKDILDTVESLAKQGNILKCFGLLLFIVFVIGCLLCVPIAILWALNTLFSLHLEYNLANYFAIVVLNLTWFKSPQRVKSA